MTSHTHSRRARRALAHLPGIDPGIAALALWCDHRDGEGRTRTEGDRIVYGQEFQTLPLSEQTGLLAHHVLHVALRHSARAATMAERLGPRFDRRLYNLVSDAVVNEVLLQGGHALPRPAVRAVELLASVSGPTPAPEAVLAEWDTDRLYLALSGTSGGRKDASQSAGDYAQERRFLEDLEDGTGGAEDATPEVWERRVEAAAEIGRAAGLGIGPVLARFADLPEPRVPWEQQLRRLMAKAVSEIPLQSHKRPANRWIAREAEAMSKGGPAPVFEPGRARTRRRARIVVGVDTSSSVSDLQLSLLLAEARSLARRTGAEAHLLAFDTEVHDRRRLDTGPMPDNARFRRGGGTSFLGLIEEAVRLDPSVLVVLTDLDGPMGPAPSFPVIWAVPGSGAPEPEFGKRLRIDA
ncbi:MAG: VWA-like domain-containing protein [Pseudomonadota bacterium]